MPLKRFLQQQLSVDLPPMLRISRFRRGDDPGPIAPETEGVHWPTPTFHDETPGDRLGEPLGEASWPTL
jgi:hypothetical protein